MRLNFSGIMGADDQLKPFPGAVESPERDLSSRPEVTSEIGVEPAQNDCKPEAHGERMKNASQIFNLQPKKVEQLIFRTAFNLIQDHTGFSLQREDEVLAVCAAIEKIKKLGNDTATTNLATEMATAMEHYLIARGMINDAINQ